MLTQLLILCPLVFIAGYIDAIAGGGGLITIPAYIFAGVPIHEAIATNNLSSGIGMSAALWRYGHSGYLRRNVCIVAAAAGAVGTVIGAQLSVMASDQTLMMILLFILPLVAIYVLKTKNLKMHDDDPYPQAKTLVLVAILSSVLGSYSGFYGPGAGTFMLLSLSGIAHLSLNEAAGTTKIINVTTDIGALIVFLLNGKVMIMLGLIAGIFSFLGNYLGSKHFTQNGSKIARPIILIVVTLFMIRLVFDLFLS